MLVQFHVNDPALIVDRPGGSVLHGLGHIVDVDVVTEHLTGATVLGRNGRTSKADICSVGQAVADDSGCANNGLGFYFAVVLLPGDNLLRQTVLPPVGLVRHDNNIPAFGKRFAALLKFLHGCKNYSVGLTALQPVLQANFHMLWRFAPPQSLFILVTQLAAGGLDRRLPQEIPASGKLAVELIVQIVSVGDDNNRRAFQRLLQIVGVEHHGQGFPTALGMPENAALAVRAGGAAGGFHCFFDGKILMIPG